MSSSCHHGLPFQIWTIYYLLGSETEKAMAPHSSTLAWKNPMNGGAWKAAVHGVAEGQT